MKAFRLVPLVLAGFCGYLHTVINRRFDEMGDLIARPGSTSSSSHQLDMPHMGLRASGGTGSRGSRSIMAATGSSSSSGSLPLSSSLSTRKKLLDLNQLRGPNQDQSNPFKGLNDFAWTPVPADQRLMAESPEYQESLLQYTMNLLPNHRDSPAIGSSGSNAKEGDKSGATTSSANNNNNANDNNKDSTEDDTLNPKPYDYNQIDIVVPASGQDERLLLLAERLGVALTNFIEWYETERRPAILRRMKQDVEEEAQQDTTTTDRDNGNGNTLDAAGNNNNHRKDGRGAGDDDSESQKLDLKFRLLVTRYPLDAQKTEEDFEALHTALSEKTTLPMDQVKLIRVGNDVFNRHPLKFNRAHARNVLHQNACHVNTCIVTAMDVDMQVLPIFFHRALKSVTPSTRAYFPIVFSEFNPETVQLVQDFLYNNNSKKKLHTSRDNNNDPNSNSDVDEDPALSSLSSETGSEQVLLPPFSTHRGLWRDFGYGMYALAGSDAKRFRFNEQYQGWGHEDNDFYKLVHSNMRVHREREHGLIHGWHPKNCDPGKDIISEQQWIDCLNSRDAMEGSALGLLLREPLPERKKDDFPGTTTTSSDDSKYIRTKAKKTQINDDDTTENNQDDDDKKREDARKSEDDQYDNVNKGGDSINKQQDDENNESASSNNHQEERDDSNQDNNQAENQDKDHEKDESEQEESSNNLQEERDDSNQDNNQADDQDKDQEKDGSEQEEQQADSSTSLQKESPRREFVKTFKLTRRKSGGAPEEVV